MIVTSHQLTATTEMNSSETLYNSKIFINAAEYGRLELVIKLSSKFSNDVEVLSEALIESCKVGHLDVVKWLVEQTAADVNYKSGWTPLTAACNIDHLDIVKYLVETCHANVNLSSKAGYQSLTWACRCASMSVSRYLLCEANDLNVNIADIYGSTALHLAVWCSKGDYTQLHKACGGINGTGILSLDVIEVLKLVYERDHKINVQDNKGNTPLHYACRHGLSDIVETLMLAGADETITNNKGKTPAQEAKYWEHSKLLKLLDRDSLWQEMLERRKQVEVITYCVDDVDCETDKTAAEADEEADAKAEEKAEAEAAGDKKMVFIDSCPRYIDN